LGTKCLHPTEQKPASALCAKPRATSSASTARARAGARSGWARRRAAPPQAHPSDPLCSAQRLCLRPRPPSAGKPCWYAWDQLGQLPFWCTEDAGDPETDQQGGRDRNPCNVLVGELEAPSQAQGAARWRVVSGMQHRASACASGMKACFMHVHVLWVVRVMACVGQEGVLALAPAAAAIWWCWWG